MKIPAAVARSLQAYINGGGAEAVKATIMLIAMGWLPNGERASQQEINNARLEWAGNEQQEIPF